MSDVRRRLLAELAEQIDREPYQPHYRRRPVGSQVVGWPDRLRAYFWPSPDVDLAETEDRMAPWFEAAGRLSRRLEERGAWSGEERDAACEVAWKMLSWGRTTRQERFSGPVVESVFRRALGMPVRSDPPMNSGWTKVAALATAFLEGDPRRAPHVIWDSRVSTSLVFRLDALLIEQGREDAKRLFPRIGVVHGRGGSRAPGGARHASRLHLRWSHAYGTLVRSGRGQRARSGAARSSERGRLRRHADGGGRDVAVDDSGRRERPVHGRVLSGGAPATCTPRPPRSRRSGSDTRFAGAIDDVQQGLDIGSRGAPPMGSSMRHPLTGPSVAAKFVLDPHLPEDAAQEEADALLEFDRPPPTR